MSLPPASGRGNFAKEFLELLQKDFKRKDISKTKYKSDLYCSSLLRFHIQDKPTTIIHLS